MIPPIDAAMRRQGRRLPAAGLALCAALAQAAPAITPAEVHVIAKEATLYGYPLVVNYRTMFAQAVERGGPQYLAPFNQLAHSARAYTAADAVPMANPDVAHTFAWLDLRAEPVALTLPEVQADRYLSVQLVDLYTHNFAYLGTRATGNGGGTFLIAGPGWKGASPPGIARVVRSETQIVLALIRTQLLDPADLASVRAIQAGMRVQPLSSLLRKPPPRPAPRLDFPAPRADMLATPAFFDYLAFVLQLCPVHPEEQALRTRLARVGIGAGKPLRVGSLPVEQREAFAGGMADARTQLEASRSRAPDPGGLFGTRARFGGDHTLRALGAMAGLYGSSREEALYPLYLEDARGDALDGSRRAYRLRFAPGALPPVNAFWSLTLYALPSQLLAENRLARHAIRSRALPRLALDSDGGLTIDIQAESPGAGREANWLPAPDGPFLLSLRLYWPREIAVAGEWNPPAILPSALAGGR